MAVVVPTNPWLMKQTIAGQLHPVFRGCKTASAVWEVLIPKQTPKQQPKTLQDFFDTLFISQVLNEYRAQITSIQHFTTLNVEEQLIPLLESE